MKNLETRKPSFMRKVMQDSTIYDKEIQILAKWLCRGNSFLAEELRSEMHIAIMNMEEGQDKALCLRVAKFRAIDYIRSRAINYSYGGAFQHISLEAMENAGFQIPLWIRRRLRRLMILMILNDIAQVSETLCFKSNGHPVFYTLYITPSHPTPGSWNLSENRQLG